MACHTTSRANCYLMGEEAHRKIKALEHSLVNSHLYFNSVSCAKDVLGYFEYTELKLNDPVEIESKDGENYSYLSYTPTPSDVGIYSFKIISDIKTITLAYDYDGCKPDRKANHKPTEEDSCFFVIGDASRLSFDLIFDEKGTSIFIGLKFIGKLKLEIIYAELAELIGSQGSLKIHSPERYQALHYESPDELGYIIATATGEIEKNVVTIYYDSSDCRSRYTKLPHSSDYCRISSNFGSTTLYIPNNGKQDHYMAIQSNLEDHIVFTYDFEFTYLLDMNKVELFEFIDYHTNTFQLKNNNSKVISIKVLNTNPLNTCRIYVDFEGCGHLLNKLPSKGNYCLISEKTEEGNICEIHINTREAPILYIGIDIKLQEKIKIEVSGSNKKLRYLD
jgi:hypothetical protein